MENCRSCNKSLSGRIKRTQFCSKKCSRYPVIENPTVPNNTIGAINELLVCADLLSKRFYVFRSVAPNSPCDLIAWKNNSYLKIEVTTGQSYKKTDGSVGTLSFSPHTEPRYNFDILAVVESSRIHYLTKDGSECDSLDKFILQGQPRDS